MSERKVVSDDPLMSYLRTVNLTAAVDRLGLY